MICQKEEEDDPMEIDEEAEKKKRREMAAKVLKFAKAAKAASRKATFRTAGKVYTCKAKSADDIKDPPPNVSDKPAFFVTRWNGVWELDLTKVSSKEEKEEQSEEEDEDDEEVDFKVAFDWGDNSFPEETKHYRLLRGDPHSNSGFFWIDTETVCKAKKNTMEFTMTASTKNKTVLVTLGLKDPSSVCANCNKDDDKANIIVCDDCSDLFHIYCCTPKISPEEFANIEKWYCPSCFKQPEQQKQKQKKLKPSDLTDRNWGGGNSCAARTTECTSVPKDHMGSIPGVPVGSWWKYRMGASESGAHRPPVAGIHGKETVGCFSIVLSGGYEDDVDEGDVFTYTGSGGRDLSGNKRSAEQSSDQTLTRENLAIARNCVGKKPSCTDCKYDQICAACSARWREGKPIRVLRKGGKGKGGKIHSEFAPPEGVRYDGLYKVVDFWPEKGKAGFIVWRYRLRRDDPEPAPWSKDGKLNAKRLYQKAKEALEVAAGNAPQKRKSAENKETKKKSTNVKKSKREEPSDDEQEDDQQEEEPKKSTKKQKLDADTVPASAKKLMDKDTLNAKFWQQVKEEDPSLSQLLKKTEEQFKCTICFENMNQLITTPCSHQFCESCFKNMVTTHEKEEKEKEKKDRKEFACVICKTKIEKKIPVNANLEKVLKELVSGKSK